MALQTDDIDLESMLLCNNGLKIETRDGMGRLAVATKDFAVMHETVIREAPSLVWWADNNSDYLNKFKNTSPKLQSAILDMYHPPLSAPSVAGFESRAKMLASLGRVYNDAGFIHKLLAISTTNAHQYYGKKEITTGDNLKQYECIGGSQGAKKSALFTYGSKISHSCLPNLAYTSKTEDGALEYKVIRPIQQGEPAAFSYIGELFQTPTNKRRQMLWETKSFWCHCTRCVGPDYCRFVKCTKCERAYLPCIYNEQGKPTWTCDECGPRPDIEKKENMLLLKLNSLEVRSAQQPLKPLQDLADEASKRLSPVHYIVIEALETIAQLAASKAASQEMMQRMMGARRNVYGLSTEAFRKIAAVAGLRAVAASECVAAGCPGCYGTDELNSTSHEAVYESGAKIFHACTDLMEVPQSSRPVNAAAMVQRYLPSMRGLFGEKDADVQLIEDKIVKPEASRLAEADSSASKPKSQADTGAGSKNKNQKPRRSTKKKKKGSRKK